MSSGAADATSWGRRFLAAVATAGLVLGTACSGDEPGGGAPATTIEGAAVAEEWDLRTDRSIAAVGWPADDTGSNLVVEPGRLRILLPGGATLEDPVTVFLGRFTEIEGVADGELQSLLAEFPAASPDDAAALAARLGRELELDTAAIDRWAASSPRSGDGTGAATTGGRDLAPTGPALALTARTRPGGGAVLQASVTWPLPDLAADNG